ncbi:hypothetical protein ACJ2A9_02180 [Anaerobacillus sp. MEB173]|uniref:hypothetical protein n=1 Tax=Anaerobacillus sp. MEB173 TaxID=3383345 RepID=UPI003F92A0ED
MSKFKKRIIALLATGLILGIGTSAIASSDTEVFDDFSFEKMLPFMKQMHPDMDEGQLEEMYENCHGENGMMKQVPSEQKEQMMERMMKNEGTQLHQQMMNQL